jgi:excisionase family DNA binding protein
MENMITPQNVADKLGITVYRVHQMIREGKLNATAYGRFYLIAESDLASVLVRPRGRPKKEGAAEDEQVEAKGQTSKGKRWKAEQLTLPAVAPTTKRAATMTAAQKKAIADRQKQRWLDGAPGQKSPALKSKATKKGGKK